MCQTSWRWGRSPSWWHSRARPSEHHYQVPPASGHWGDGAPRCPAREQQPNICFTWRRRRNDDTQTSHPRSASSSAFKFPLCPAGVITGGRGGGEVVSTETGPESRITWPQCEKGNWLNSEPGKDVKNVFFFFLL